MSLEKLVYMANRIGRFFNSQGQEQAVAGTTDHIRKFWDPHMRASIAAHLETGGAGLDTGCASRCRTIEGRTKEET